MVTRRSFLERTTHTCAAALTGGALASASLAAAQTQQTTGAMPRPEEKSPTPRRTWREEKVFIVFHEHGANLKALMSKRVGDWVVTPKDKPADRGQTVTWKIIPETSELELYLPPDVFETYHIGPVKGEAKATIRRDAKSGYYLYEAYCDGQLAVGGSGPGIIVDGP